MKGRRLLGHPLWQALGVILAAYLILGPGVAHVPPLLGIRSAPVPKSVLIQYMITVFVGVLLYVSADEARWRRFLEPIHDVLVEPSLRRARIGLFVFFPLAAGGLTYRAVNAGVGAPSVLRSVHPAPPSEIDFHGRTIRLAGLENPLRTGDRAEHLAVGARVYVRNCVPCHGDRLDGSGQFAHAFDPVPADFTSNGTIAQLTESYVFWRIAKGGPGLPREGTPWNSAMPAWEDFLTANEIWSVILYLYDRTGWTPRTWELETAGEER